MTKILEADDELPLGRQIKIFIVEPYFRENARIKTEQRQKVFDPLSEVAVPTQALNELSGCESGNPTENKPKVIPDQF